MESILLQEAFALIVTQILELTVYSLVRKCTALNVDQLMM